MNVSSKNGALRRRVAPSVPLTLELEDDAGGKFTRSFRLAFDMNAAAEIEERTGLSLLDAGIWQHINEPVAFSVMFYAALLANHPEYRTVDDEGEASDEGLEVIRSYMQESNAEPITEALWKAYLIYLPREKRELMEKLRAKAEAQRSDGGAEADPFGPPAATAAVTAATGPAGSSSGASPATTSGSAMTSSAA